MEIIKLDNLSFFEQALGFSFKACSNKILIYALCDYETLVKKNITLLDFIKIAKQNNVKLLQYRDKTSSLKIQEKNLNILKTNLTCPIIINDKLELLKFADGVHLGQEDLQRIKTDELKVSDDKLVFKLLKKRYPNKLFGLSTHNEMEILKANELDLDMIGLGAYRATSTKDVDTILGDKASYLAKISKHPVCLIGGVQKSDLVENISFNVISSDLYED